MISIKSLTKNFDSVIAVNNLTIDIKPGINGLVGENGAGKSTLLRLIADIYQKSEGQILIDGKSNSNPKTKKNVFLLSDNPMFLNNGTMKSTMKLYSELFDMDKEKFDEIITLLDLPRKRRLSTFSKGMKRQFFLAIALAMKADYILMDEAFDGIDPIMQDIVKQEIIKLADKKTFIISSHNLLSLERLCDNFILLSKGRLAKNGALEDMGTSFKKYQAIFPDDYTIEDFQKESIDVISYRKIGSITHIVLQSKEDEEEHIRKTFKPSLLECVPLDDDEVFKLEMIVSRREEK